MAPGYTAPRLAPISPQDTARRVTLRTSSSGRESVLLGGQLPVGT